MNGRRARALRRAAQVNPGKPRAYVDVRHAARKNVPLQAVKVPQRYVKLWPGEQRAAYQEMKDTLEHMTTEELERIKVPKPTGDPDGQQETTQTATGP